MNAAFQRIAKRDKKAFLSDQCNEIEESNRMGKTDIYSRKLELAKGTFHGKMGSIKERNRGGGRNTQKNYTKKIFPTQITVKV